MVELLVPFAVVCLATAYVCTSVKEDADIHLLLGTARLFGVMAGGIAAFALVVQLATLWAG